MNTIPLALPTIKAFTPDDIEVRIIDENHDPVPYDEDWDLVGITVMLHVFPAAKRIAREFRKRGTRVAFGGFFPSLWKDDAKPHADTIISGEAEAIWGTVLTDLRKNRLRPFYSAGRFIDLKEIPFIRREFFPEHEECYPIETSRGCPYHCDFCSVANFYGGRFRHRPIDHVIRQLEALKDKMIFFVDDNITGRPDHACQLFREIIPLKIKWCGQFTLNNASNEKVMELAAESGCQFLFTGYESLSRENLQSVDKRWADPKKFAEWTKMIHDVHIGVYGSFMFGFEGDSPDIFQKTLDFCEENHVELALFSALFPIKGSRFHQQLSDQKRIFETDPSKFNGQYATFHPRNMTAERLDEGLRWAWKKFYSKESIKTRLSTIIRREKLKLRPRTGSWSRAEMLLELNMAFRAAVRDF